jgi:hypothetical protein
MSSMYPIAMPWQAEPNPLAAQREAEGAAQSPMRAQR